jgi:hypothetical protein
MGKVQTVERWWNGSWGRMARLDVWLRTDGERWDVWIREGGAEGKNSHTEYDTEPEAREALEKLKDARFDWRLL